MLSFRILRFLIGQMISFFQESKWTKHLVSKLEEVFPPVHCVWKYVLDELKGGDAQLLLIVFCIIRLKLELLITFLFSKGVAGSTQNQRPAVCICLPEFTNHLQKNRERCFGKRSPSRKKRERVLVIQTQTTALIVMVCCL